MHDMYWMCEATCLFVGCAGGIEHIRGLEQLCDLVMDACLVEQLRLPAEIAAFVTDYYGAKRLAGPDVQVSSTHRFGARGRVVGRERGGGA